MNNYNINNCSPNSQHSLLLTWCQARSVAQLIAAAALPGGFAGSPRALQ